MCSAMRAASVEAAPRSTTPYAPGVTLSDMRLIHEIVPCHHAAETSGKAVRESRLIAWTYTDEHLRIFRDGIDRDKWQVSEAALRRSICRTCTYRTPRSGRVGTEQTRRLTRTEANGRAFDPRLQLRVELLPSFEVAGHVFGSRRRVQRLGLDRIAASADRHLKCAQRFRRLRGTEPLHSRSRQQRAKVLAAERKHVIDEQQIEAGLGAIRTHDYDHPVWLKRATQRIQECHRVGGVLDHVDGNDQVDDDVAGKTARGSGPQSKVAAISLRDTLARRIASQKLRVRPVGAQGSQQRPISAPDIQHATRTTAGGLRDPARVLGLARFFARVAGRMRVQRVA